MGVDQMRTSRGRSAVIFMEFTRLKHKFQNSLFCSFEGDDSKYYFRRIEDNTGYEPQNIIVFTCSGKGEVLRFCKMIKEREEYKNIKMLYFVDLDFDLSIRKNYPEVYETPCYSIENLYSTNDAFTRILKSEFNYNQNDPEFEFLTKSYEERHKDFHEQTLLFNAWLACERVKSETEKTSKTNVSDFNIQNIIPEINLDLVKSNYDKLVIESLFPDAVKITDEEIVDKTKELIKRNLQQTFRGKFEIDFIYNIIEAIKKEFAKPKLDRRLTKKPGVQLNQSKKNLISEFSHYASTPSCLLEYLGKFRVAV